MRLSVLLTVIAWVTFAEGFFNPFSRLYFGNTNPPWVPTKAPVTTTTTPTTTTTTTTTTLAPTTDTTTISTSSTTEGPGFGSPGYVTNLEQGVPSPEDLAAVADVIAQMPEFIGREDEVFNFPDDPFPDGKNPMLLRMDSLPPAAGAVWDCLNLALGLGTPLSLETSLSCNIPA